MNIGATVDNFSHAGKQLWGNPLLALFSTLIDIAFFFCYGFFTQPVRDTMLVYAQNFTTALSQLLQDAGARYETPSITELAFSTVAKPYFMGIISWMFILFVVAFILYSLFQGTAWWLAGTRKSWLKYLGQFAALNAIWFVIFGVIKSVIDFIDLRSALMQSITKTPGFIIPGSVRIALFLILAYFAMQSYAQLEHHNWKTAFTKSFSASSVLLFLAIIAICAVFELVLFPLVLAPLIIVNEPLGLTISIAILGPLAFFLRTTILRSHGIRQ